jgi:hypothetical protein
MKAFVISILILMAFEWLGKIIWLAKGQPAPRTMATMSVDVIALTVFIIWGLVAIH